MYKKQLLKLIFCPLFLLLSSWALAQQITVTGKVTDENGQALPGVTITIKNSSTGTNSDIQGKYLLHANNNDVLVFSMLGFDRQEVPVNNRTVIDVRLSASNSVLNEVVVVGYGTQKRKDLTGSISSIKGDVFKDQPITNPIEALEGRVAGVNVITSSAAPDAAPQIIIRGVASFYQPNPLYIVDGVRLSDLSNVNPQDIVSLDVMKDAASAAIYGSAAAGGVIVVTTKKGSGIGGPPQIAFSARYGLTKPKVIQLLGKDDFIKIEKLVNPATFTEARQDTLSNTNWVDLLYRNGTEQNYNLSISGASTNVNYLISGFYNQQTGIFLKNYSNIGGIRINTDYKLSKFITVGEELNASQRITSPLVGAEAQLHNAPFRTQPIIPLYNKNGTYGTEPAGVGLSFQGPNPIGAINSAGAQDVKNNFQGNLYADIKLPLHLDFRTTLGYSYYSTTVDDFQNTYVFGTVSSTVNSLSKSYYQSSQLLTNYVLNYNQSFGKHNISAMAGYEQIANKTNSIYAYESAVGLPSYTFNSTSASAATVTGTYDPQSLIQSQFARLNYNFNERYFLSASIRQDANYSVFGPNKQKGIFPAASAGWTISEEPFFKNALPGINSLKIRGSYGQLGNSNISPYTFTSTYGQFISSTYGLVSTSAQGFAPGQSFQVANTLTSVPNPNLHWETITETNLGIDGEALHGSLYFSAELYNKKTSDLIYQLPLPPTAGFTSPYITNIGDVDNRGIDLMAGYRSKIGKLGFDISANLSYNQNKVTKLSGAATDAVYGGINYYSLGDAGFNMMPNQSLTITKVGIPFGSFYGYKAIGIFSDQATAQKQTVNGHKANIGDLQYQDLDGNGVINNADQQVIGNPNPKFIYGFNIRVSYAGFDLAALFNGVWGVQLFNGVKAYEQSLFADGNTTPQVFHDSFLGSNGLTSQPRLLSPQTGGGNALDQNQNYSSVNSYFVENGDYLKLKNLQLGYTFSGAVLRQISVKSLRVFIMANNVFTITKYSGLDPELGSAFGSPGVVSPTTQGIDAVTNYPQARIFSAGINVSL
ncbi:MAG: outer membrane protein nutrient binding [Mucilaginibacter sp.]|nr:outer membrane protein nutrient binding [Mucilaginibacter sp.]